jgi:glycosyltransferase involved in cell wall biosynthesis
VRIVCFADVRFPLERANGIQTMETCYALAERGHRVELVVRPDTQSPRRDPFVYYGLTPIDGLTVERAPVGGPAAARRLGYLSFALGRAMGRGRADILFTRDLGVASLLLGIPRSMRAPLAYESHGYGPAVAAALPELVATASPPGARKLQRLARREARVWQGADAYVTITVGLAREMTGRFGKRRHLAAIPDGCRLPAAVLAARGALDNRGPTPTVAYAGHLYAWKGVDVLLRALALVPEARGLIVGGHEAEPDLARLKQLAAELGIANRVTFTGLVEPSRVPELLQRATVLALPNPASAISTSFTSPLKLFEYMAAGRAIVASDLPAIREVLRDGADALLVTPGDPAALGAAIRRLLDDPALASTLARAALDAVPKYGWDRRAERLDALFNQVTSRRR